MTYDELVNKAIDWMPIFFENKPFYFTEVDTELDRVAFLADGYEFYVEFLEDGRPRWGRYS